MTNYWNEYSGAPSNVPLSAYNPSGVGTNSGIGAIWSANNQQAANIAANTAAGGANTRPSSGATPTSGGGGAVSIGAQPGATGTTYFPGELASLMAQMLGMQMSDAQFYANLGFQREQAERMAKQWREEFDWSKQESIAGMLYNQQLATGFMQTMPFLTESGASIAGGGNSLAGQSIWNARPDLKAFYDQAWGAGSYSIDDAVKNWLSMTDDADVIAAGRDANTYAGKMGLPTVESAAVKAPGDMQKTVEREQMEGTLGLSYGALMQGLSGPEKYVQKAQTEAALAGSNSEQWFKDLAQRTGLPAYGSIGYDVPTGFGAAGAGQVANAPATGVDPNANLPAGTQKTVARDQMEESQRLQYAAMLADKRGPNDWTAYWNNTTPGWAQGLMQGKVGPAFQAYGTAPVAQQPPTVPDIAPQVPVPLDANNVDPLTGLGYNALGTTNWKGGPTVVGEYGPEIVNAPAGSQIYNTQQTQQMAQPQYQMPSWMPTMFNAQGPMAPQLQTAPNTGGIKLSTGNDSSYAQHKPVQANPQGGVNLFTPGTNAPATNPATPPAPQALPPGAKWMDRRAYMISKGGDPNAMYAADMVMVDANGNLIGGGSAAPTTSPGLPTGTTGLTNIPYGHKITYAQWAAMAPSRRAGLQSDVEAQGGWWDDFMASMQKSWPQRQVNPTTYF